MQQPSTHGRCSIELNLRTRCLGDDVRESKGVKSCRSEWGPTTAVAAGEERRLLPSLNLHVYTDRRVCSNDSTGKDIDDW